MLHHGPAVDVDGLAVNPGSCFRAEIRHKVSHLTVGTVSSYGCIGGPLLPGVSPAVKI